eukprot:7458985-Pyramimonas_sp.AAC.1
MLIGVLKPEWETATRGRVRTWEAAWKEWEKIVSLYEAQSLEKVTKGTRIAVVVRWAPEDVKAV